MYLFRVPMATRGCPIPILLVLLVPIVSSQQFVYPREYNNGRTNPFPVLSKLGDRRRFLTNLVLRRPFQPPLNDESTRSNRRSTCDCGIENAPDHINSRVVNGAEVKPPDRFPWMALITEASGPLCGGAIISDRYILTAAHCLDVCEEEPDNCRIKLGSNNVTGAGAYYDIEKLIKHDEYRLFLNDIGLIRLKKRITFSRSVKPVCLPKQISSDEVIAYKDLVVVAGWGLTGNGKSSDILMHFSAEDWLKKDKSKSRFCRDLLCLTQENGRFESGDSGGPAWIMVRGRAQIIGIVSHYRLHRMRLTRVPLFTDWIKENVINSNICRT